MTLVEARLPDLLLDLHDQYGNAFPKPQGMAITFTLIREKTTYQIAKKEIDALLALHGVVGTVNITPGPEVPVKVNRTIKLQVAKDLLM